MYLRHVSDKVLRAKSPHGTCGNIMFLSKSTILIVFYHQNLDLRFLCLINSFYRRYVCCIHNRSNGSNRSSLFPHYFFIISSLFLHYFLTILHYFFTILHYFPIFLHYFLLFLAIPPLLDTILTILGFHSCVCKF